MSTIEMELNYYRAAFHGQRPDYVPARVRLLGCVYADHPRQDDFCAEAGEHDSESNKWGAISVKALNGEMLGIKPGEFSVIAWKPNSL